LHCAPYPSKGGSPTLEILRGRGDINTTFLRGKCEAENLSYYNELVMDTYVLMYIIIYFLQKEIWG